MSDPRHVCFRRHWQFGRSLHSHSLTFMFTHVHSFTFTHVHVHLHLCSLIFTFTFMFTHIHVHSSRSCSLTFMFTHIHIHVHSRWFTFTFMFTHIHLHVQSRWLTFTFMFNHIHWHSHSLTFTHIHVPHSDVGWDSFSFFPGRQRQWCSHTHTRRVYVVVVEHTPSTCGVSGTGNKRSRTGVCPLWTHWRRYKSLTVHWDM